MTLGFMTFLFSLFSFLCVCDQSFFHQSPPPSLSFTQSIIFPMPSRHVFVFGYPHSALSSIRLTSFHKQNSKCAPPPHIYFIGTSSLSSSLRCHFCTPIQRSLVNPRKANIFHLSCANILPPWYLFVQRSETFSEMWNGINYASPTKRGT